MRFIIGFLFGPGLRFGGGGGAAGAREGPAAARGGAARRGGVRPWGAGGGSRCPGRAAAGHAGASAAGGGGVVVGEGCRSGLSGRSRKPLCALWRTVGSNPTPSARHQYQERETGHLSY